MTKNRFSMWKLDAVLEATVRASGLEREKLTSSDRHRAVACWRQAGMFVAIEMGFSQIQTGRVWCRDHTTVRSSTIRVAWEIEHRARSGTAERVAEIREELEALTPESLMRRKAVVEEVRAAVDGYREWLQAQNGSSGCVSAAWMQADKRREMVRLAKLGWTAKGLARRYELPVPSVERVLDEVRYGVMRGEVQDSSAAA